MILSAVLSQQLKYQMRLPIGLLPVQKVLRLARSKTVNMWLQAWFRRYIDQEPWH